MTSHSQYIELTKLTDYELFKMATELATAELLGYEFAKDRMKAVFEECQRRNPKIYEDAIMESNHQAFNTGITEQESECHTQFEYMNDEELEGYLKRSEVLPDVTNDYDSIEEILFSEEVACGENYRTFAVKGSSMVEANIIDGSKVIVEIGSVVKNGDIAVVSINDFLFIKRLIIKNREIWLLSENKALKAVRLTKEMDFKIIGKVVLVYFFPERKEML
jgi:hypothetical protein